MMQGTEFPARNGEQYKHDADDEKNIASSAINVRETASLKEAEIETVIGFEALYTSMRKCTKGVIWKDSVASYRLNAVEKTMRLCEKLHDGSYRAQPPVLFTVTSPKRREIASVAFTDRVYQRSLNDNVVYPQMVNSFIYDNFACQTGKGTDACRERLKEFMRSYYRKHGQCGYVAQFDISGYYPNMNHSVTEETFREKLNPDIYALVETILRDQYPDKKGYNPGSQLIQIAGISVLDRMDHMIKEDMRARYYIRYMDDFLILHHDKEYLDECVRKVTEYLKGIKFTVNEKKTRVFELKEGIEFLGFKFSLTESGKVLMQIKSENVKRQRKKLRRLVNRSKQGLIPKPKVDESYSAWRNHASKGNSYKLLQRMDSYYSKLWEE